MNVESRRTKYKKKEKRNETKRNEREEYCMTERCCRVYFPTLCGFGDFQNRTKKKRKKKENFEHEIVRTTVAGQRRKVIHEAYYTTLAVPHSICLPHINLQ